MASATSGWCPWNPNAMRVSSRILVLVDSTSAWERPVSSAASMASRWVAILRWRCTKDGIRERRAQLVHWSSARLAFFAFDGERVAQSFFEEVGAPQAWVGLGDPVELAALPAGEVAGVLPECVAGLRRCVSRRRSRGSAGDPRCGWSGVPWLGSRLGVVRCRARRSPRRRRGTGRRCGSRSGPVGRRRGRSSRPYRPKHG